MTTLTQQQKSKRQKREDLKASEYDNQTLSEYLIMISERAQKFTTFERRAILSEAAKRINSL